MANLRVHALQRAADVHRDGGARLEVLDEVRIADLDRLLAGGSRVVHLGKIYRRNRPRRVGGVR